MATIQKRTNQNGETSYRVQVRIKGRPPETATFQRLTDARQWAQQTEADLRRGKHFKTSEAKRRTMGEAVERYIRDVLAHTRNPINRKTYLAWWKKELGAYTLADVTPALIVEKRDKLVGTINKYGRAIGRTTANRYTQALGHVFSVAIKEWGWHSENPVGNISKFKEPRGRVRYLSDNERVALLAACKESDNPYLYQVVVLALSTGARKMEILSMKWQDISFERNAIILNETKNGERRVLPLAGHARMLLKDLSDIRVLGCDYVFPAKRVKRGADGKFLYQPIDIRTAWETALKKAKVEDFRFHDLRHSAASYLAMNGATLAEISEVLGHKTLQMVKRYAHLSEAHTSTVVASMNERIFGDGRV
ncbi:MAG: site-specific integrase [Proteobacteria bacterium]|nr:site-specific integrase [Pseudomonadota bacterium]